MSRKAIGKVLELELEQVNIGDLRKQFVGPPQLQARRRFSASSGSGAVTVGWYRGQSYGLTQAYNVLKKKYPDAAKYLLKCYGVYIDHEQRLP